MPHRVVASRRGRGVQEKLRVRVPEGVVELQEDLRVGAHLEHLDRVLLPGWEGGREFHGVVLQDADGESADCVGGFDAVVIRGVDGHAFVGVLDLADYGVEEEPGVVGLQKGGGFTFQPGVEAALVPDEVVLFGELVEGLVVAGDPEDKGALFWSIGCFPI